MAICSGDEQMAVVVEGKSYKYYAVNFSTGSCRYGRIGGHESTTVTGRPQSKWRSKIDKGYEPVKDAGEICKACGKYKVGTTYNHVSPDLPLHLCVKCGFSHTPGDESGLSTLARLIDDTAGGLEALLDSDDEFL
jgi:hypothetical protein